METAQLPSLTASLPKSSAETPRERRTKNFLHTTDPRLRLPATSFLPLECRSGTHTFSLPRAKLPPAQRQKLKTARSPASTTPPSLETTRTSLPAPPHSKPE